MIVLGWRCWLEDGSTVSFELPSEGALGFVVYYLERVTPEGPHYRNVVVGADWYVVRSDGRVEGFGHRQDGTWSDPPEVGPGDRLVKSVPSLPAVEWRRIRADMIGATEWP